MATGLKVFISYSHKDEALKNQLLEHLSSLQREGLVSVWHDRRLTGGSDWQSTIDEELEDASIVLLLVSASFLSSEYCYGIELKRALERHALDHARVIPVILRPTDWTNSPLSRLQALPTGGKAVTVWNNIDEGFANVASGLRAVAGERVLELNTRTIPVGASTLAISAKHTKHPQGSPEYQESSADRSASPLCLTVPWTLLAEGTQSVKDTALDLKLVMRETGREISVKTPPSIEISRLAVFLAASLLPHLLHRGYEWTIEHNGVELPTEHTPLTCGLRSSDTIYLVGNHRKPKVRPFQA